MKIKTLEENWLLLQQTSNNDDDAKKRFEMNILEDSLKHGSPRSSPTKELVTSHQRMKLYTALNITDPKEFTSIKTIELFPGKLQLTLPNKKIN